MILGRIPRLLFVPTLILFACTAPRVTLLERTDGHHMAQATGPTEGETLQLIRREAEGYCKGKGKAFEIVRTRSEFQNLDAKTRAEVDLATALISQAIPSRIDRDDAVYKARAATHTDTEKRVIITFKCV